MRESITWSWVKNDLWKKSIDSTNYETSYVSFTKNFQKAKEFATYNGFSTGAINGFIYEIEVPKSYEYLCYDDQFHKQNSNEDEILIDLSTLNLQIPESWIKKIHEIEV